MSEEKKPGRRKKSSTSKKKAHQVYATDAEWSEIVKKAEEADLEVSPFLIKKGLS